MCSENSRYWDWTERASARFAYNIVSKKPSLQCDGNIEGGPERCENVPVADSDSDGMNNKVGRAVCGSSKRLATAAL